jgi:hypothetical protein
MKAALRNVTCCGRVLGERDDFHHIIDRSWPGFLLDTLDGSPVGSVNQNNL